MSARPPHETSGISTFPPLPCDPYSEPGRTPGPRQKPVLILESTPHSGQNPFHDAISRATSYSPTFKPIDQAMAQRHTKPAEPQRRRIPQGRG